MYDTPIFIKLYSNNVERMVNVRNINSIEPFSSNLTFVFVNNSIDPLLIGESYEEIKKKLENVTWMV